MASQIMFGFWITLLMLSITSIGGEELEVSKFGILYLVKDTRML